MITQQEFDYGIGDLLLWRKTSSLCMVVSRTEDSISVLILDGGSYPNWKGEVRGYNRNSLTKNVDFLLVQRASTVKLRSRHDT